MYGASRGHYHRAESTPNDTNGTREEHDDRHTDTEARGGAGSNQADSEKGQAENRS